MCPQRAAFHSDGAGGSSLGYVHDLATHLSPQYAAPAALSAFIFTRASPLAVDLGGADEFYCFCQPLRGAHIHCLSSSA